MEEEVVEGSEHQSKENGDQQSMASEMPLPRISDSPTSYLEALDTVISCSRLLKIIPADTDNENSVQQLLQHAKKLFIDNATNLVVQTLKSIKKDQPLPTFWEQVKSQQECALWLQMFDIILFCWSKQAHITGVSRAASSTFVEEHICYYGANIRKLREIYTLQVSTKEEIKNLLTESRKKVDTAVLEIKQTLKPVHIAKLSDIQKPTKQLLPILHVIQATLEVIGLVKRNEAGNTGWIETRTALKKMTFEHIDILSNYHKQEISNNVIQRLENFFFKKPNFNENALENLSELFTTPDWKTIVQAALSLLKWLKELVEYQKIYQCQFTIEESLMKPYLEESIKAIVKSKVDEIKKYDIWKSLSKEIKSELYSLSDDSDSDNCETILEKTRRHLCKRSSEFQGFIPKSASFTVEIANKTLTFNQDAASKETIIPIYSEYL